jgi:hypothetical protein
MDVTDEVAGAAYASRNQRPSSLFQQSANPREKQHAIGELLSIRLSSRPLDPS